MRTFDRRTFLRRLGASAALAPFVPVDVAAGAAAPRRLILYFSGNGLFYPEYVPDGADRSFTLRRILEPLAPYRDRMLLFRNVTLQSFFKYPHENDHSPICHLLTGVECVKEVGGNQFDATGPSLDQHVARRLGRTGSFDGLVLGVDVYWPHTHMFFRRAREPVFGEGSVTTVWKNLFAPLAQGGASALDLERQSTIDLVRGEIDRLRVRISTADRPKLDAHLDHLRTLELRLAQNRPPPTAACDPGAPPGATPPGRPARTRALLDLGFAALRCDITRVLAFCASGAGGGANHVYDWLPGVTDRHHDLSHGGGRSKPGDRLYEQLTAIGRWHAGELARFLGLLDSVKEGDRTMLDNSLVLWFTEHQGNGPHGDHGRRDVPFVTFGSAGGYFRTGRIVDCKAHAHNDLLLSFLHAMGFEDERTFGDPTLCKGPVPGLT